MIRRGWIISLGLVTILIAGPALAQQPAPPGDPDHPPGQAQTPAPVSPTPPTGAGMPSMEMCHRMMHEMMAAQGMPAGSGMGTDTMGSMMRMPMMPGQPMDAKTMAQMMEMRGEMMKAMGEIMMKHAQRMQGQAPKR